MKVSLLEILEERSEEYVSGENIAQSLNMSRANVWKEVSKLRQQGFVIDSKPSLGYRLSKKSDVLSAVIIKKHLKDKAPDYIDSLTTITSTNDYMNQLVMNHKFDSALIVAENQTKGRGRMGRSFYSPSKSGVYMSMLFRPKMSLLDTQLITIASALAIRQILFEDYNVITDIKWLNDLYINSYKVGGILTEGEIELESLSYKHLIVGIGLNINKSATIPSEITEIYGAIFKEERIDRNKLIARIYDRIITLTNTLPNSKKTLIAEYKKYSNVLGKYILIAGKDDALFKAIDIDENGYLVVEAEDTTVHVLNSGEVSVKVSHND